MAKRKLVRIREIESLVAQINFKDKEFKKAIKFECKQNEINFNRLRHWLNREGKEVYISTWNNYKDYLIKEGISSKLLIQSYHHTYSNFYACAVFTHVVNYLNNKNKSK